MRHGIRKRSLQQLLERDPVQSCSPLQMVIEILQQLVEATHFIWKGEPFWLPDAADKEGSRISHDTRHVPEELVRSPHSTDGSEIGVSVGGIPQGFLCPISEGRQEMTYELTLWIHDIL